MDTSICGRARALALTTLLCTSANAPAALLLDFDFERSDGTFTLEPGFLAPGIASATWDDVLGLLADFAGQPGRALALSGFTNGNALSLAVTAAPGLRLVAERLRFDLRVSASGPTAWQLADAGGTLAAGPTTTQFGRVEVVFASPLAGALLDLTLSGSGASSAAGTLRLDNVELHGSLQPVPLPGPLFLIVTPLLGLGLRAVAARCGQRPGAA
jgi:hypothetical protein